MTPAERFRWSDARWDWWDWWVPCPACGYPMALDPDEYCCFCAFMPHDGFNRPNDDPDLVAARASVAHVGMAEPKLDEENEDYWQEMVTRHMEPGFRQRKARFAEAFERLVHDEQRGFLTREEIIARMVRMRMAFFRVQTEAELPEPREREFRRQRGLPY